MLTVLLFLKKALLDYTIVIVLLSEPTITVYRDKKHASASSPPSSTQMFDYARSGVEPNDIKTLRVYICLMLMAFRVEFIKCKRYITFHLSGSGEHTHAQLHNILKFPHRQLTYYNFVWPSSFMANCGDYSFILFYFERAELTDSNIQPKNIPKMTTISLLTTTTTISTTFSTQILYHFHTVLPFRWEIPQSRAAWFRNI